MHVSHSPVMEAKMLLPGPRVVERSACEGKVKLRQCVDSRAVDPGQGVSPLTTLQSSLPTTYIVSNVAR